MRFHPSDASDLEHVLPLIVADPACARMNAELYQARLAAREYRPEWTWLALPDGSGEPLALAFWWAGPDEDRPDSLDGIFCHPSVPWGERAELAAGLLAAAHAAYGAGGSPKLPEYHFFLPAGWRDQPAAVAALDWRRDAARRAGLGVALDRVRFTWTPADGVPEPSGRLRFDPEPDDEVFVDLFRRVLAETLDATSRKAAARLGAEAQARADVEFYRDTMLGDRAWWRVVRTRDGETVGFGLPSRNTTAPVVGYLGVLPEHRGHGYAAEILADITRFLATEAGAERINADTDLLNRPMAAAFHRLGYRDNGCRLVLSAS